LAGSGGWKEVELGWRVEGSKRKREEEERIVRLFEGRRRSSLVGAE